MLQPAALNALDIHRDGGSLSASFRCSDGNEYTLFLTVMQDRDSDERLGFASAELERFAQHTYTSPITGISTTHRARTATPVSWEEAAELLSMLRTLPPPDPNDAWMLEIMIGAASRGGIGYHA